MSKSVIKFCRKLLKDSFGDVIEEVGSYLLSKGPSSLAQIVADGQFNVNTVKKAVGVLVQHNIVEFQPGKRVNVEYSITTHSILVRLRFAYYIYSAKTLYGDEAELMIEELLLNGQMQMSQLILKVKERLETGPVGKPVAYSVLREKFEILAKTHFVQQCPTVDKTGGNGALPSFVIQIQHMYDVPSVNFTAIDQTRKPDDHSPTSKRRKINSVSANIELYPDKNVFWQVSYERFDHYLRDQEIISAVTSRVDMCAGEMIRAMMRLSELKDMSVATDSSPLSAHEIFQSLPKELGITKAAFEQYLQILTDSLPDFVGRTGDSGGGEYTLHFKQAFTVLTKSYIESVIQERFGSKSLRIFRLLLLKRQLEADQVKELAMLSTKEAKELLYAMFIENYIIHTEVSKAVDFAPFKTFYLFSVNLNQLTRMLTQHCYEALFNLATRREHEMSSHKRVLEKQMRMEAILASLEQGGGSEEQRSEVEGMLTANERLQLSKVQHTIKKLEQSELQMTPMIFVLETYLRYVTVT